jgi:hypothetical protein
MKRTCAKEGRVALAAMVLCAVLVAWGSVALAKQEDESAATDTKTVRLYDPFAYRTIMVSSAPPTGQPETPPGLEKQNPRRPPLVPFRLPVRSAFRPGQVWQTR